VARSRKVKQQPPPAQDFILPADLEDDEEDAGSVIPDDDGWISLEAKPKEKEAKRGKGKNKPA
jgi:hypothetical protein